MKNKVSLCLVFVILFAAFSEVAGQALAEFMRRYNEAYEAYQQGDYQTALELNQSILEITPSHPTIVYNVACMYAMVGNSGEAFRWLNRFAEMGGGLGLDVEAEPDFDALKETSDFQEIVKRIEAKRQPVLQCEEAFRIPEKDLIPEGIAFDPVEGAFYFGSVYKSKIIKRDRNGRISDFTAERQDGLRSVLGMKVDVERRILWANSVVRGSRTKSYDPAEEGWAGVFKFDLNTGKLIKKYGPIQDGYDHSLNDLVVTRQGDVYITDTNTGEIYTISHERDTLEQFLGYDAFMYLNGITLSPDETRLYVADTGNQIFIIDLKTKSFCGVGQPDDVTTYGIDGLYFYMNSLIAVQNQMQRVVRFFLDGSGNEIIRCEMIEANNPLFNRIPTTGVIVDKTFFFMANTQLRSFNQDNTIFPMDRLEEVVVLKTTLDE